MKQLLTLLFVALSLGAHAQNAERAELRLSLSDGSLIAVRLDGRMITRSTNSLTLDGIDPGWHEISVYRDRGYRRRPQRLFTSTLRLGPATVNEGVVDVWHRTLRLHSVAANDEEGPDDYYDEQGSRDRNPDTEPDYREGYGSYPQGRSSYPQAYRNNRQFSDRDLDDLRRRVADRMMDDDKEKLMETALNNRSVRSTQVRQMLDWLSFESTKLEFAKWAYSRVSDPEDYWKIEDAFSFESSKDEFNRAINAR